MAIGEAFDGAHLFAEETMQDIQRRVQRAASAAFDMARDLTPVDRGYLKHAWTLSIDQPVYRDPEEAGSGVKQDLRGVRATSVIYITNGKSYAEYLNDGTSRIPAHNMLEHAVSAAMDELY